MNTNELIRKEIKQTTFRLTEITNQLAYFYNGIRWFCYKKTAICFSAIFVSILSYCFPEIKESPFSILFFFITTGGIQVLAFRTNNRILKKYYNLYGEGINYMTKLSNLIDWSSLRKYYMKSDDDYPIRTISTFMQESNRLLSPVRRGFRYYRLIQYAIIMAWSLIIVLFAPMFYKCTVSLLKEHLLFIIQRMS